MNDLIMDRLDERLDYIFFLVTLEKLSLIKNMVAFVSATDRLDLVAIDEAHVVCDISRDFREDARVIREMRESNILGRTPFLLDDGDGLEQRFE